MSNTSQKWVVDEKINKERLKELAIQLEQELKICASLSKDIAEFSNNSGVLNVIQRAKNMEIENAEELGGMQYWLFETDVGDYLNPSFRNMQNVLAEFEHTLKCWRLENDCPGD